MNLYANTKEPIKEVLLLLVGGVHIGLRGRIGGGGFVCLLLVEYCILVFGWQCMYLEGGCHLGQGDITSI